MYQDERRDAVAWTRVCGRLQGGELQGRGARGTCGRDTSRSPPEAKSHRAH